MTMDVIETGDDNCDDNIEAEVTLTAASGDKFNLRLFVPSTQGTTFPLTYVVTGGPGHFRGRVDQERAASCSVRRRQISR